MEELYCKKAYFTNDEIRYIENIKEKEGFQTFSAAIRKIIHDHMDGNASSPADKVWDAFEKRYSAMLTRIRLGINTADRNSQVIIKMLNAFFLENGDTVYTDEKDTESIYLMNARDEVKKEIEHYKQLKDERENRKKNGN